MVRQCPQTDGCLDLYHPPCPTRQFLVYIHSQLVPTSPTKLGVKLSSPKQMCMLLPKVEKLLVDVAVTCGNAITQSFKNNIVFCRFHDGGKCGLTVWTTYFPHANTKNLDQSNKRFPSLEHLECLNTGRKLQKLLVCTVTNQGVSQPSPKHQHETP